MNDERFLRDWLRDTTDSNADPNAVADRLVARLPDNPQQRRWLPWWPTRRSKPDDHSTHGRTRVMISPVTATTAGAIALATAGFLYLAQPTIEGPGGQASFAVTIEAPLEFSGRFQPGGSLRDVTYEAGDGVVHAYGAAWTPAIVEMSEPMLDGQLIYMEDQDQYPDSGHNLSTITYRIVNDDGAWQGSAIEPSGGTYEFVDTVVLVGEGAYEGLFAAMQQSNGIVRGVIFPAAPPPASDVPQSAGAE